MLDRRLRREEKMNTLYRYDEIKPIYDKTLEDYLKTLQEYEYSQIDITDIEKVFLIEDSFIIYICVEGSFKVRWSENSEEISLGETVLVPAALKELVLEPTPEARLLEVYIKNP